MVFFPPVVGLKREKKDAGEKIWTPGVKNFEILGPGGKNPPPPPLVKDQIEDKGGGGFCPSWD